MDVLDDQEQNLLRELTEISVITDHLYSTAIGRIMHRRTKVNKLVELTSQDGTFYAKLAVRTCMLFHKD